MRLNNFLIEGRSKEISESEFIKLFKENCLATHYLGPEIYRGTDSISPFLYINPSLSVRKSPYASNQVYMLLLSNMPSWSGFPKRNRSLTCSTDKAKARQYGDRMYVVFPYNKAKIGVSPTNDIWFCTKYKFNITLDDINYNIEYLAHIVNRALSKDMSYQMLLNVFAKIDEFKMSDRKEYDKKVARYLGVNSRFLNEIGYDKPKTKLIDCLNKELAPEELNIKLTTTGKQINGKVEVWTDSECLLVQHNYYYDNLLRWGY